MKTVNIGELKNQLSGFLQYVREGEEVVIRDRDVPVARILPFRQGTEWDHEAELVSSGGLKMPEEEMDWNRFFHTPAGAIGKDEVIRAIYESRGEW